MRFAAPEHITEVSISTGPLAVEDGHVEAPETISQGDIDGLKLAGFVPVPAKALSKPASHALKA